MRELLLPSMETPSTVLRCVLLLLVFLMAIGCSQVSSTYDAHQQTMPENRYSWNDPRYYSPNPREMLAARSPVVTDVTILRWQMSQMQKEADRLRRDRLSELRSRVFYDPSESNLGLAVRVGAISHSEAIRMRTKRGQQDGGAERNLHQASSQDDSDSSVEKNKDLDAVAEFKRAFNSVDQDGQPSRSDEPPIRARRSGARTRGEFVDDWRDPAYYRPDSNAIFVSRMNAISDRNRVSLSVEDQKWLMSLAQEEAQKLRDERLDELRSRVFKDPSDDLLELAIKAGALSFEQARSLRRGNEDE